jgi:2-keto-4-pentenoate hydratase/2-oxohepta-3-ene-1,7-dioic acid hydratase in catechol pathway
MTSRYVRVKTDLGQIHYGLLQVNRSIRVLDAPPWLQGQLTEIEIEAETYELLAPCCPSKIVAVGKNYARHAAEMGTPLPSEPLLFLKPPTALIGDRQSIYYPTQVRQLDYEGELALVIGDRLHLSTPEEAATKIWGYTIANDVTGRDLQKSDGQWTRAKGFDTFCPLGPWIVREVNVGATIQTFLNESPVQSAQISDMVFAPEKLVAYISQVMTLLPGDVILTGTPEGVGPMQVGDRVRVEIEGIGKLENLVTS